jgi:glycosyltransferase involved in cell wall biosynthesis
VEAVNSAAARPEAARQGCAESVLPGISVVVSTYNRARTLPRLIRCLESQESAPPFEVLIVDDCSTDDTWQVIQELARHSPFPLRPLRTPVNSGPATGRNIGWRAARAPLVAFVDDDCRPDPGWLTHITAGLENAEVVQGRTDPDPDRAAGRGPFARVLVINQWSGRFETCNMGYRRDLLERLGGFDESFPQPWGEDTDLGCRAVETGASMVWASDALVIHDVDTAGNRLRDWVMWIKDTRCRAYSALLVKKHPSLRTRLHRRYFLEPHHPRTLAALVGLALLATGASRPWRWLAAAALATPWLQYRSVMDPRPALRRNYPVVLPMTFVGDAIEVGVMMAGSVRFRTILL